MIQRIQTVYLFLVVVLGVVLGFCSPVDIYAPNAAEASAVVIPTMCHVGWDGVPYILMLLSVPVLALVNIFLFKRRILQARLNVIIVVLCLGMYAMLAFYIWYAVRAGGEWYLTPWASIPLVNLVLTQMATRRILKDEALVRAADRIR